MKNENNDSRTPLQTDVRPERAEAIAAELSAWFSDFHSKHIDAFFCITVEKRDDSPLVTVTVIPDGGFTREQIDRATSHLNAIASVLSERAAAGSEV